jgi:hypothetical protein
VTFTLFERYCLACKGLLTDDDHQLLALWAAMGAARDLHGSARLAAYAAVQAAVVAHVAAHELGAAAYTITAARAAAPSGEGENAGRLESSLSVKPRERSFNNPKRDQPCVALLLDFLYASNLSIDQPYLDPMWVRSGVRQNVLDDSSGQFSCSLVLLEDD